MLQTDLLLAAAARHAIAGGQHLPAPGRCAARLPLPARRATEIAAAIQAVSLAIGIRLHMMLIS